MSTPEPMVLSAPDWTTLIDNFDRANGVVNAGVGSAIWSNHAIAVVSAPTCVIQGNLLAPASGWASCLLQDIIPADFDMAIDCVVAPAADGQISFWMCGTNMTTNSYNSFVVSWDSSGQNWQGIAYTGGGGQIIAGSPNSKVPPTAGKTYWVSKRGLNVELYQGDSSTGPWTLLSTFLCPVARSTPGNFGFQFPGNNTVGRWDNLRGGPVLKPDYSAVLDDFNRADGAIYAGAGAAIWTNHEAGSISPTPYVISVNRIKSSSGGWIMCTSLIELDSDFDIEVDVVVAGAGFGILFGGTKLDTAVWNGGTLGFSGGSWYGTQHVDGTGFAISTWSDSGPVAGETYWVSKRGTKVSLYKATSTTPFVLIGTAIFDKIGAGAFGFQSPDAVNILDNLRGGPIKVDPPTVVRIKTTDGWIDLN